MKKVCLFFLCVLLFSSFSKSQTILSCDFTVAAKACVGQEVKVTYVGGTSANATYLWDFDGAVILSGTGQGPWFIRWTAPGEKHVTLSILFEGQSCNATRPVVVVAQPALFHMTGGGSIVPGTAGVAVGLSGSEAGIIYKLRLNGQYTGVAMTGTGQHINFGIQSLPGNYTAVAKVDGLDCMREMEGVAVVTSVSPPMAPNICMVTFDTAAHKNRIVWNKQPGMHWSHVNIFKETYQNNVFSKIGEVPFASLSVYVDSTSDPLVKSDKFKISVTDSSGLESEKSPYHKTIHLNINPGIYGFNLLWNHYEGFEYQTCRIHRKPAGSPWEIVDSVAANVDSYTDFYASPGITAYFIEVVRPEPCSPSAKSNANLSVVSNIAAAAPLGFGDVISKGMTIFPNPVTDMLNLVLPGQDAFNYEISHLGGVPAGNGQVTGPRAGINVSALPSGLYVLKVTGDKAVSVRKFVKD